MAIEYNHDPSIIFDRLKYGFELERALTQPIRKLNRPELEITYQGKVYASKNELYRELLNIVLWGTGAYNRYKDFRKEHRRPAMKSQP